VKRPSGKPGVVVQSNIVPIYGSPKVNNSKVKHGEMTIVESMIGREFDEEFDEDRIKAEHLFQLYSMSATSPMNKKDSSVSKFQYEVRLPQILSEGCNDALSPAKKEQNRSDHVSKIGPLNINGGLSSHHHNAALSISCIQPAVTDNTERATTFTTHAMAVTGTGTKAESAVGTGAVTRSELARIIHGQEKQTLRELSKLKQELALLRRDISPDRVQKLPPGVLIDLSRLSKIL